MSAVTSHGDTRRSVQFSMIRLLVGTGVGREGFENGAPQPLRGVFSAVLSPG